MLFIMQALEVTKACRKGLLTDPARQEFLQEALCSKRPLSVLEGTWNDAAKAVLGCPALLLAALGPIRLCFVMTSPSPEGS